MYTKKTKISSLNCRGLNNRNKILFLKDTLDMFKIDICFLQETHLDNEKQISFLTEQLSNFSVFCPLSDTKSKGVCILINKNMNDCEIKNFYFYENRIVCVDVEIEKKIFSFVNIYAPNL